MNAERMSDMGYMKSGDLWISPTSGEVMSFEQARQEAQEQEADAVRTLIDCADGGPTNGHGE